MTFPPKKLNYLRLLFIFVDIYIIEPVLFIVVIVLMVRIASADDQSPWLWGAVAFAVCFLAFFIPLPYFRVLLAAGVTYGLMLGYKIAFNK